MTCMQTDIPQSYFLRAGKWKAVIRKKNCHSSCTDLFGMVSNFHHLNYPAAIVKSVCTVTRFVFLPLDDGYMLQLFTTIYPLVLTYFPFHQL